MRTLRLAAFLLIPSLCLGQGFLYDAFDARSLGMGSAPFASGIGASEVLFNPASVASRQGLFMNVGGQLNLRQADLAGQYTSGSQGNESTTSSNLSFSTDNPVSALPQIGFSYGPSLMPIGFGISVTEPFAASTVWPSTWVGGSSLDRFNVHAIYTTLAFGFRVNRIIAIGGGVHITSGGFTLQNVRAPFNVMHDSSSTFYGTTDQIYDAAGTSAAVSASLIVTPAPQFSLAIGFTSGSNIPVKGTLQNLGFSPSDTYREETFHSSLPMPSVFNVGVDIHPTNALRVDLSAEFIGWGGFVPFVLSYTDSSVGSQSIGPTFKNAMALRLGVEVLLSRSLALRAGAGYASSALNDGSSAPYFADAGAFLFSFGVGYQFTKNIRFDLGYRGAAFGTVNGSTGTNFSGQFSPSQNLIAASIALAFEPTFTANPLTSPTQKK